ncbi:hypothetical protein [Photorhabdus bodei]|uniref:Up-regulated in Daf-2 domain-containing protein n=1 Tax=Photorhabdus bodei TaxID=2029681 RepID=A0ABX0AH76_9GAMM|nr:hypothetical protein [Photorhabdus bodei]NDK97907.1 hypothetical protein [Photorhabdus bodei]NDL02157.1 hypothetical protein [Photorhabdus bodei]NDL06231.1 hypothetical protein [Photorhabdus bodei]
MSDNNQDVEYGIRTEQRQASVKIINNTGKEIISYAIRHHYSSVYKNPYNKDEIIQPASGLKLLSGDSRDTAIKNINAINKLKPECKSKEEMLVDYNIGVATTGTDWWIIMWVEKDGGKENIYVSTPNNFRGILDYLEERVRSFNNAIPATEMIHKVGKTLVDMVFNDQKTDGYKMFTLRDEDSIKYKNPEYVSIVLGESNGKRIVDFIARSGHASTNAMRTEKIHLQEK